MILDRHLDPPQYHSRAPWFARLVAGNRLFINGTQTDMDAELGYAAAAGIKFWAFGWYPAGRPLHNAWTYYQNSSNRTQVNWCILIGTGSLAAAFPPVVDLISYFKQPIYEAFEGRPLMFVMHENTSLPAAAAALVDLRATCAISGVGNPYVVLQSSVATLAATDMATIGADAVSAYAQSGGNETEAKPYQALAETTQAFNAALVQTGKPVVPLIMTGWDRRPRIDHPPPFDITQTTGYVEPGTPTQIATHVSAVLEAMRANPTAYPSRRALIYSWDECDEGGSTLIPSWTSNGPNESILKAIASIAE